MTYVRPRDDLINIIDIFQYIPWAPTKKLNITVILS